MGLWKQEVMESSFTSIRKELLLYSSHCFLYVMMYGCSVFTTIFLLYSLEMWAARSWLYVYVKLYYWTSMWVQEPEKEKQYDSQFLKAFQNCTHTYFSLLLNMFIILNYKSFDIEIHCFLYIMHVVTSLLQILLCTV